MIVSDAVISSLILQQMAPWLGTTIPRASLEEAYQTINLKSRSVFVYRVKDGDVSLLDKPGYTVRTEFHDSTKGEPDGRFIFREEFIRANMYRDFFARILDGSQSEFDTFIAIDVSDRPIEFFQYPIFTFQKLLHSRTVLIPDVDFLHSNFYIPSEYSDDTPYEDKRPRAVFVGSTTAGRTITADDVRTLSIPRLRAGVFFKGNEHVDFRVVGFVQCESDEVISMIKALGINSEPYSWQEKFKNRFIISMDGNGATCSRVAIGLSSQSVLVKYDSPHLLYYMGALIPWRHYIPVSTDEDVLRVVEMELRRPLLFKAIADESREFAACFLSRKGVCRYSFELFSFLDSLLSGSLAPHDPPRSGVTAEDAPLVEVGAHIQNIGDVWGWPGEWIGEAGSGNAVEAIAVVPTGIPRGVLSCRVVLSDGSLSNDSQSGAFCGTRGHDSPLLGFELNLGGDWSDKLTCTYQGRFTDGTLVGPLPAGDLCRAPTGAKLESFHIDIRKTDD